MLDQTYINGIELISFPFEGCAIDNPTNFQKKSELLACSGAFLDIVEMSSF